MRQSPSATKAQHTLCNEHWQRRFSKSALIGTGEVCLEKNPVASHVEHSEVNQREDRSAEHFDSIQGGTQHISNEACSGSIRLDPQRPDSEPCESGADANHMVLVGMQNSKQRKPVDLTTEVMGLRDVREATGTQAASPGESKATIMARIRRTRQARAEHSQLRKEDEVLIL